VACAILYTQQERIIFHAHPLPEDFRFQAGQEVEVPIGDQLTMNCVWLKSPQSKGVILYLHGNRGNARRALYQTRQIYQQGYDILIPDYRGFGKTEGSYSHQQEMFEDIEQVYEWLLQNYSEDQIVPFGYSLGSGLACYLAEKYDPQQVFLVAPFLSFTELKNEFLPFIPSFIMSYKFDNERRVKNASESFTIFHGTKDPIIPYEHGRKLSELGDHVELITLEGGDHRSVIFSEKIATTLSRKLK